MAIEKQKDDKGVVSSPQSYGSNNSGLKQDGLEDPRKTYVTPPQSGSGGNPASRSDITRVSENNYTKPDLMHQSLRGGDRPLEDDGNLTGQTTLSDKPLTSAQRQAQLDSADKKIEDKVTSEGWWVKGTHYNPDGSKSGYTKQTPQEIVDAGGEPGYKTVSNPNQTYTGDTSKTTTPEVGAQGTDNYLAMRDQLMDNLQSPDLAPGIEQTYTGISAKAGEFIDPNSFQVSTPDEQTAQEADVYTAEQVAKLEAKQAQSEGYTAAKAQVAELEAAMEAQLAQAGQVDPTLAAQYTAAKAQVATMAEATKGVVTQIVEGAAVDYVGAEAAYQKLNEVDPKTLAEAITHEVPNSATVKGQLDELLGDLENGEIPIWAQPAVAAAESQMSARGMSSSSVGRNALYNSIIQSAMPIAQQDAQAKLSVFQQDITNEQQAILANSQFFQTLTVKNLDNKQQAAIVNATNASNAKIAEAQNMTQASIANAQNFLQMNISNLEREQQVNLINAQNQQQAMLSNQAAENSAKQFNAANEQQANQFNANLAASIEQFNATQANSMSQFNTSQVNDMAKTQANLQQQVELANQAAENQAAQFGAQLAASTSQFNVGQSNEMTKAQAQLEQQVNLANAQAQNAAEQFNAGQQNAMAQFNANLKFQAEQFNVQNATAIEQSNAQWRRQMNQIDTAGQNAVNQANAMNKFNLNNQALTFLWQEQRDAAKWENDAAENEEERKTRLAIAALGNESATDAATLNNIKSLAGAAASLFDSWG